MSTVKPSLTSYSRQYECSRGKTLWNSLHELKCKLVCKSLPSVLVVKDGKMYSHVVTCTF